MLLPIKTLEDPNCRAEVIYRPDGEVYTTLWTRNGKTRRITDKAIREEALRIRRERGYEGTVTDMFWPNLQLVDPEAVSVREDIPEFKGVKFPRTKDGAIILPPELRKRVHALKNASKNA